MRWRTLFVAVPLVIASGCSRQEAPPPVDQPTPTQSSRAIEGGPGCKLPDRKSMPKWVPDDLPLPEGTYFYRPLKEKDGLHRGRFVVRLDTVAFRQYVKTRWIDAGISLGRQDSEPGETEALFRTKNGFGIFKANDVICDPPYATLLLILGD